MKKPKDILFARHQPVEAKLDAIRNDAVAAIHAGRARETKPPATAHRRDEEISWWRRLISLNPRTFAAQAAVWLLIFAFKFSTHDESQVRAKTSSEPREVVAELRQQRLFFAELAGLRETREVAPPKSSSPRPRSERRFRILST